MLGTANANAQTLTFFPSNSTINYALSTDDGIVGYASGSFTNGFSIPSSPTVNVVAGGGISTILYSFNHSIVNVNGGNVGGALVSNDSSTINLNGGKSNELGANDNSIVNISGGVIGNDGVFAQYNSTINVSGGDIDGSFGALDNSRITLSGGKIGGSLVARNTSIVNIRGGRTGGALYAEGDSTLNLFGSNLAAPLIDPQYIAYYSLYSLSGTLEDGTLLNNQNLLVLNGSGASFHLFNTAAVPEPGSLALLLGMATVSIGVLSRRRK